MVCWLVGALLVKKHALIKHRRSSLGRKAPLWSHPLHEVKDESSKPSFLPRKLSHPSQDVYHRHVLPSAPKITLFHFFSGSFTVPPSFLWPVCMQESQAPFRLHSCEHCPSFDYPLHFLNLSFHHPYPSPVLILSPHTTSFQRNQHP